MRLIRPICFLGFLFASCVACAQDNSALTSFEIEVGKQYDPEKMGSFTGAMTSCYNNYKRPEYLQIYQSTMQVINKMSSLDRNTAMGHYATVVRRRIFASKKLTSAECDRMIHSNWVEYLNN
jgi:hypothetical protein